MTAEAAAQLDDGSAAAPTSHPPAFWFFFWGEFAERCSYYGMRAILPLYLTMGLHFPDTKAGPIYYWFKMACYFLPLVGGFLADRVFGKYWTIVGFSVPYVAGHFILGIGSPTALFIALALLAGGSGVIKPNISTLLGLTYDQLRPGQEQLRAAAFLWFYFSINIGSLLSTLVMPVIRNHHGYAVAFQFPAWVMAGSLAIFAAGKRFYGVDPVEREHDHVRGFEVFPTQATPQEDDKERKRRQNLPWLFAAFFLFIFFFLGYEHTDSIWVFFMRDYVNRHVPGLKNPIAPDQLAFINPLFVVICVPLFTWLFRRIDPEGRTITPSRKIFTGFLLTASAPGLMALAALAAHPGSANVWMGWVVLALIALTVGEVLLYGTALEMAYAAAPAKMKGFVTACFLLTSTLGNLLDVFLSKQYGGSLVDPIAQRGPLTPAQFFAVTCGITLAAALAFLFIGKKLDPEVAPQSAE